MYYQTESQSVREYFISNSFENITLLGWSKDKNTSEEWRDVWK